MSRILALDVGEARIGVAVSDASSILASPYTTLHVPRDESRLWAEIQRAIDETGAERVVVGLPISLDGYIHAQGERILAFVDRLKQHITLSVSLYDERLSTVEARRLVSERDQGEYVDERGKRRRRQGSPARSRQRHKGQEIDALAAAVILQDYLDHMRGSNTVEDTST